MGKKKESTCIAGDPDSIPGLGISPGDGIDYPLQYSWAFLVAHYTHFFLIFTLYWYSVD